MTTNKASCIPDRITKSMRSVFVPLLATCLAMMAPSMFAQGKLTGTVTNSATGRTLQGARVFIQGTGRQALTDEEGVYRFDDLPAGDVILSVSYTGLNTLEVPVQVRAEPMNRDVGLTSDIYMLSKFVVA